MHKMSGSCSSIHPSTRGRRAVSELTFQVAIFTASLVLVDEDEQQVDFTRGVPSDVGPTVSTSGPRREPAHRDLELQGVPGHHLASKACFLDPSEERKLVGVAVIGQNGDATELCEGFHHQYPRQCGASREVSGKERLLAGEPPTAAGSDAGFYEGDLTDKEERIAMREKVCRFHCPRRLGAQRATRPTQWAPTSTTPGRASSAIRRCGSSPMRTNWRRSPRERTSRARIGG